MEIINVAYTIWVWSLVLILIDSFAKLIYIEIYHFMHFLTDETFALTKKQHDRLYGPKAPEDKYAAIKLILNELGISTLDGQFWSAKTDPNKKIIKINKKFTFQGPSYKINE